MASISKRLHGIDLARAVAIMGMMLIHFNENVGTVPFSGPDWLVWLASQIEGRAAVAFVILAGIGMSLMSRRARLADDAAEKLAIRSGLLRRAGVLFAVGLAFHYFWDGDILHYYGVFITLGSFLLFAPAAWLWIIALLLNAGFFAMLIASNNYPGWDYYAGWDWDTLTYVDFWSLKGFMRSLLFNGWFPLFPWFGFLLVGIWIGRQDLHSRSVRLKCMLGGAAASVSAACASWLLVHMIGPKFLGISSEHAYSFFGTECLPPTPTFVLQAGGAAVFMIALCLEIADRLGDSRWLRPWLVFGQCALSIYIGHVFLFIIPLPYLGWAGKSLWISIPTGLAAILTSLLLCLAWLRFFERGPLEIVIRRLSVPARS
jgi:uncharacterized membrane protein YeiB